MVNVILNPNYSELLKLRFQLLRQDLGSVENCVYSGDNLPKNFHVGAVFIEKNKDERLIGIGSFHLESFNLNDPPISFRLRGMATHPDFFRQKVGSRVLTFGIDEALKRGANRVWFNAREKAVPFYESLGFQVVSDQFDINPIGPHYRMQKDF